MREIRLQLDDALLARLNKVAAKLDCSVETLIAHRLQAMLDAADAEAAAADLAAAGLAASHWNQEESTFLTDAARAFKDVPRGNGVFSSSWDDEAMP